MCNSWILLLLFFCGCQNNNGCGNNNCGNNRNKKCENKRPPFEIKEERRREQDCDNDFIQPRPFNSFTTQNTCGCENKSE